MKLIRNVTAAVAAFVFAAAAAFAADSVAGTWKWTQQGRQGGQATERSVVLKVEGGKVTGTLKGFQMGDNQIPDAPVTNASFKDGVVSFSVEREFNGNKFVTKYSGKLEGDKITGSAESPGRDGNVMKRDWVATRAK